jgi:hypothetical protein
MRALTTTAVVLRLPYTPPVGGHIVARSKEGTSMDRHQDLRELLGRLGNVREAMEEALGHVGGIEDDYRRGLLEAHIRGALRELNEQIAELARGAK